MEKRCSGYDLYLGIALLVLIGQVHSLGDCRNISNYGDFCQYKCQCYLANECNNDVCSSGCNDGFHGDLCTLRKVIPKKLRRSNGGPASWLNDTDKTQAVYIADNGNGPWVIVKLSETIGIKAVKLWRLSPGINGNPQFGIWTRIGKDAYTNTWCRDFNTTSDVDLITCEFPRKADTIVLRKIKPKEGTFYLAEIAILDLCKIKCRRCNVHNKTPLVLDCIDGHFGQSYQKNCEYCIDGQFGRFCNQTCRCKNRDDVCNKDSGGCPNGCFTGYIGTDCQQKCPDQWFGDNCTKRCNCQGNCSHVNGYCIGMCMSGYKGDDCQSECSHGMFGANCLNNCHCQGNCSRVDGFCNGACERGYQGNDCQSKCDSGTFGIGCKKMCHCYEEVTCNTTTGTCPGECAPGFIGRACQQECPDQWFGDNCTIRCNCQGNCSHVNGYCIGMCMSGYKGDDCQSECSHGMFGANCLNNCHCQGNCSRVDGFCNGACERGYQGNDCQSKCDSGTFGLGCKKTCHCYEEVTCNTTTGTCPGECAPGFIGRACQQECDSGTFGLGCKKMCHCVGDETCNPTTGKCPGECAPGFIGRDCQQECDSGTFGLGCKKRCHCVGDDTCNATTGTCQGDCAPGFIGPDCQQECFRGLYGSRCNNTCNCLHSDDICDKAGGTCALGCNAGFVGMDCQTPCKEGRFGINCANKCNCLETTDVCDKTIGGCMTGCASGFSGSDCQKVSNIDKLEDGASSASWVAAPVVILIVIIVGGGIVVFVRRRRVNKGDERLKESHASQASEGQQENENDDVIEDAQIAVYANVQETLSSVCPVEVNDLLRHVQTSQANGLLQSQFQSLPQGRLYSTDAAYLPENKEKCRYRDTVPYDYNRVCLQETENQSGSDFINASYIKGCFGDINYIASQGPTQHTLNDFWRMVWETECGKIVMLTNLVESAKKKVELYWPNEYESTSFGDVAVKTLGVENSADYCIRTLHVTKGSESRTIYQFHYQAWPDHGIPSDCLTLIEFRNLVNGTQTNLSGPNIVHCSAGVGRTGTYIMLDILLERLVQDSTIDIFSSTCELRRQRLKSVQTLAQYIFLHQALAEASLCLPSVVSLEQFSLDCLPIDSHTEIKKLELLTRKIDVTTFGTASLPQNIVKHRDTSVMADDWHRVFLSNRTMKEGDYINAVFIPTLQARYGLIATQVPLPNTIDDFWTMLQQQQSSVIIALYAESQVTGVTLYPDEGKELHLETITITTLSLTQSDSMVYVTLKLQQKESSSSSECTLIGLTDWPESKVFPLSPQTLVEMKIAAEDNMAGKPVGPVTVICRNGRERCALFCSLWNILDRISIQRKVSQMISVKIVQNILPKSITEDGYRFLYNVTREYLQRLQQSTNTNPDLHPYGNVKLPLNSTSH